MKPTLSIEQWCPSCDCSSRENRGRFVIATWYCEKCLEEMNLPSFVKKEEANDCFRKMREMLDER